MHGRLLATLAAVAATAAVAAAPAAAKTVTVTESDSGDLVSVHTGDTIRVVLDANPSTGYSWKINAQPNPRVVKIRSSRYVADPTDGPVVGSGGQQITVLKAKQPGRTRLGMRYVPPGEQAGGSDFDLFLKVRVKP